MTFWLDGAPVCDAGVDAQFHVWFQGAPVIEAGAGSVIVSGRRRVAMIF